VSDAQTPWHDPNQPPPGPRGCGAALLIILGVLLLLPGVCSLAFISAGANNGLAALGLLVGFGGLMMILSALASLGSARKPPLRREQLGKDERDRR
jgi:hypothetical protein